MPPKGRSKSSAKAQRAKARKERQLLEARMRECQEKCAEARGYLEPTGRNAEPNFTKAKTALNAAIEAYDADSLAFFLLGQWNRMQGLYTEAIECYSHALDLEPTNIQVLEWRANSFQNLHDYLHAIEDNTSIISLDPENDHAYNMRGLCVLQSSVPGLRLHSAHFESCVHDFSTAVRLNEANYYAMANLGKAYEVQGHLEKAIECYGKSLDSSESYTYARFRRGCTALCMAERAILRREEREGGADSDAPEASTGEAKSLRGSSNQSMVEAASLTNSRVPGGATTLKEVKAEVRQQVEEEEEAKKVEKLLKLADADFTMLLDRSPEAKILTADATVVLNIGICALLSKNINRAEEHLKLAQEIVLKRPSLVEEGEAPPLENMDTFNSVLAIRLNELQKLKDMAKSAT
ncbi:tetratricopeptide repeat (TPR) protein [Leishmania tarentolae]|uniref:Tetratricopeptide repeat (TPR) protein n=1 Tax=Leishmania tarentolae TaxID=5689 RepID=A0A640KGP0_LEITA|nr:tetratricopeptide repeat (TPR) protein [Leishmania tarentolae]